MDHIKALVRVAEIEKSRYSSSGDYSVTDLISPPRIVALRKRYGDQVDQPLSSVIPALLGTFIHEGFEKYLKMWVKKHDYKDYTFEEQVELEVKLDDGTTRKVSGRYDIRDGKDLIDIKSCKAWKMIFDPDMIEWHQQQNLYDFLLWSNGVELDSLNILAIYKDWQENMSLRDKKYPKDQIAEYSLERWNRDMQKEYFMDRLMMHVACEKLDDDKLPQCTREERWERFNGGHTVEYAIMKTRAAKRAAKVIRTSLDDAYIAARGMKGITDESCIEIRYSKRLRCEKYCSVNSFCNEYAHYCKSMASNTLNDYLPIWT
jgi:hypothetical protein